MKRKPPCVVHYDVRENLALVAMENASVPGNDHVYQFAHKVVKAARMA